MIADLTDAEIVANRTNAEARKKNTDPYHSIAIVCAPDDLPSLRRLNGEYMSAVICREGTANERRLLALPMSTAYTQ